MTCLAKARIFLFLVLFLFLLTSCAKPPVAFKPRPEKYPQELIYSEPSMVVEINGQKISPLVPTLFLLPEESIVVQTQRVSPHVLSCRIAPSLLEDHSSQSFSHHQVWFKDPQTAHDQIRQCLKAESWSVVLNGQPLPVKGNNLFSGKAPKDPGLYTLEIDCRQSWRKAAASRDLREEWEEKTRQSFLIIVLHPFSRLKDGFIDQFPVGFYSNPEEAPKNAIPKTNLTNYFPPKGFVEVTPENQGVLVSQHYRFQDFTCHLFAPYPHYMALSPALLLKLELLTLKLKQLGISEPRLTILSGFRTPWYNQTVSGALWSRHIYGDAADIILDISPQDGLMDDLNHDGRIDFQDAMVLARLIEEIEEETGLLGGLGVYDRGKNEKDSPYIHMDARGFKARW